MCALCWSDLALGGCPLDGRLYGEGLLLVEGVVLPLAGGTPLCLRRPVGLRALLGLEGGLALALLWGLPLLGLALRDLGKGEDSLSTLPLPLGLTAFLSFALGEGGLLPRCLECDGDWRERLSVRLTGDKEEE